jgi:hypothetical protein
MDGESEMRLIISFLVTVLLTLSPAHAYVGPGLGAGSIAVVLGILASILLAIFAVVWYPLKRFQRWLRARKGADVVDQNGPIESREQA